MIPNAGSDKRISRLEREILRLNYSPSMRLGKHITKAMRQPWRAPFLIFTLPWQILAIGFEMLGRRAPPHRRVDNNRKSLLPANNTVVMFPTNGIGFGHFTRMLATAKRMKKVDPSLEIIFFTTMPALHILKPYRFPAHFVSGYKSFQNLDSAGWNTLIEEELTLCLDTHRPKMFIFDGSFPYRGMLRSIALQSDLQKVWMRRGTFKTGSSIPVDSISHFDLIIHPEDSIPLSENKLEHGVDVLTCPPIILLEEEELLDRIVARRRLHLPSDCRAVYVQLGAGEINDIQSEIRLTIEALTKHEDVHVVLGESMIGARLFVDLQRVHLLRDYPNSMYFKAFDATIQAGGYNSFHEVRRFGLPTLFFPNMNTGMDDQLVRCLVSIDEGWGQVLEYRTASGINNSVETLLSRIGLIQPVEESKDRLNLTIELLNRIKDE